jgi:hypothetical protein
MNTMMIEATTEAQEMLRLGVPATVDTSDVRLTPGSGVNVYYLDADGLIVSRIRPTAPWLPSPRLTRAACRDAPIGAASTVAVWATLPESDHGRHPPDPAPT